MTRPCQLDMTTISIRQSRVWSTQYLELGLDLDETNTDPGDGRS
jgi:hypothetical protein